MREARARRMHVTNVNKRKEKENETEIERRKVSARRTGLAGRKARELVEIN